MSLTIDDRVDIPRKSHDAIAKPGYRPDVQGLRAVAVVLVVLYHGGFGFDGGFVGVDAFFVLSGFVITRRLRWEVATTGTVDIGQFVKRRIVRILPAASLMTIVTLLATSYLGPMSGRIAAGRTAISAALFNANTYLAMQDRGDNYFDDETELNPFLHMWSLSVEEQFYLVFPLVVLATVFVARRRRSDPDSVLSEVFAGLVLLSFTLSLLMIGRSQPWAFYGAPFRAWEFLAGALIVWIEGVRMRRVNPGVLGAAGFALLFGSAWFFQEGPSFPGVLALVPVAGTVLVLISGSGQVHAKGLSSPITNALRLRSVGYVGRISYAWYLWHWPLIVFAKATVPGSTTVLIAAIGASFVIAALSTAAFEEPIRERITTGTGAARVLVIGLVVTTLTFGVSQVMLEQTLDSPKTAEFHEAFADLPPVGADCSSFRDAEPACRVQVVDADGEMLLLGDSTALQLFGGAGVAAEALGFDMTMAYTNACPTNSVVTTIENGPRCHEMWETVFSELSEAAPDIVVVAVAVDTYIIDDVTEILDSDGVYTLDRTRRAELLDAGIVGTLQRLEALVDDVVFVGVTPKFRGWNPSDCSFAAWSSAQDNCGTVRTWAEVNKNRVEALDIQESIDRETNVGILTLDPALCAVAGCATNLGERWIFRDANHISVEESRRLGPLLEAVIEDLLQS